MSKSFGSPLGGLDVEGGGNGLGDARVQRRRAAGDDQRIFPLAASRRPIASGWPHEGRVISQRWSHCDGVEVGGVDWVSRSIDIARVLMVPVLVVVVAATLLE